LYCYSFSIFNHIRRHFTQDDEHWRLVTACVML